MLQATRDCEKENTDCLSRIYLNNSCEGLLPLYAVNELLQLMERNINCKEIISIKQSLPEQTMLWSNLNVTFFIIVYLNKLNTTFIIRDVFLASFL